MQTYLERVVDHLHTVYGEGISELCLVLPNRRAGLFLKNHIANKYEKTLFAPALFGTEDFVAELTGLGILDRVNLLFEFYQLYEANEPDPESFDEFSRWANTLLNDLSEIDQYVPEPSKLFHSIDALKALELWSPDRQDLTETQKGYLHFWDSIGRYHTLLTDHLKEKRQVYQGLAYRILANRFTRLEEDIELQRKLEEWQKIVFIGFNALSQAEEVIIKRLLHTGKAEILWDTDDYYMEDKNQEAGMFLRDYRSDWRLPDFNWQFDVLDKQKNITVTAVPGNTLQAKVCGQLLHETLPEDHSKCAVVLADESLLVPVLQSLPEAVQYANVTMGYPLGNSSMHSLISAVFQLQENGRKFARKEEVRFYHADISKVLLHPLLQNDSTWREQSESLLGGLKENNVAFAEHHKLVGIPHELQSLFEPWQSNSIQAVDALSSLITALKDSLIDNEQTSRGKIELEYLFMYAKVVNRVRLQLESFGKTMEIKTLQRLFNQMVGRETVSFFGEPLRGLQIMGMLETRTLDFETVILLSANEDVLPKGRSQNSFIPYETKRSFGIPTYREKDAIFAYHFYHLLQRAQNVHLLYNTEDSGFGGGEKSRFITQLQQEMKGSDVTEHTVQMPVTIVPPHRSEVDKNPEVIELTLAFLQERGLSPSALNAYINCPLDFFHSYVLGLSELDEVEEDIEASTFGTVIHKVLDRLYKPYEGEILSTETIEQMIPQLEVMVIEEFRRAKFRAQDLEQGRNLLSHRIIVKYLRDFLHVEKRFINRSEVHLLHTEQRLETTIEINGLPIKLKGTVDRIDKAHGQLRVIDYKTGNIDGKALNLKGDTEYIREEKFGKAVQLLMYGWLFMKTQDSPSDITSGIISLRKVKQHLLNLQMDGSSTLSLDQFNAFEQNLRDVVKEMLNPKIPFGHNEQAKYCRFCND